MDILLIIGVALAAGLAGGLFSQKVRFPQVVGYIVIGAIIGRSGLGILNGTLFDQLAPISSFSLGLIGFMIGRELQFSVFKQMGKVIFAILWFEVLGAFLLVAITVWFLTHKVYVALVFGALATATAPAATVDVLWEYRAKGVLTTTIFSIVALDDVLALFVYAFAVSYAKALIAHSSVSFLSLILVPLKEIGGSIALGAACGFAIFWLAQKLNNEKHYLPLMLAVIMLCIGISNELHFSLILTCMILGMTLSNLKVSHTSYAFKVIEDITTPIYILFFVLIGSQLQIAQLPGMGLLGIAYIVARIAGKMLGTRIGGKVAGADIMVQKYLGLALFSQAGVAIGLALAVHHEFSHLGAEGKALGTLVLNVIMASTFVVQIIGPPCVKYAITKAGEITLAPRSKLRVG